MANSSKRELEQNARTKRQEVENFNNVRKKILDVNSNCLDQIFNQLNLKALINSAEANKQLGRVAASVFARKCKGKTIVFGLHNCSPTTITRFEITDNDIFIFEPLLAFKTLRLFGASILNIKLLCEYTDKIDKMLMSYVNTYCCDTLESFSFENGPKFSYTDTKKPYKSVKYVSITGKIAFNGSQFNDTFPKMQRLILANAIFPDQIRFVTGFNQLERLKVDIGKIDLDATGEKALTRSDIREIVRLNPQLEALSTNCHDLKFWEYANEHLNQLKTIGVHVEPNELNNLSQPIRFEFVESLCLEVGKSLNRTSKPEMNFSFGQLKECILIGHFDIRWIDMIIEIKSIEKLNIISTFPSILYLSDQNMTMIATELPELTALTMCDCSFSVDSVIKFLNECSTLRKLTIETSYHLPKMNELYSRVNLELSNWRAIKPKKCHILVVIGRK